MRNFEINPIWGFLGAVLIGCIIGHWFIIVSTTPTKEQQPQIKTCECLTYYQWQYLSTKRDKLLDKRKRTKQDKDSIIHYERLLGMDETQNLYPER